MNLSIYTACYNLSRIGFDWKSTLSNWTAFLQGHGQIVIAVNTSTDSTHEDITKYVEELKQDARNMTDYVVFKTDIPYENPLFDGVIKNEALKKCTMEFASLLDIDEVFSLNTRMAWEGAVEILSKHPYDALLIPSIDLFHDEKHYRPRIGNKWYLHRNRPGLMRGRVAFAAREDGTTDITKSDSTELIGPDGQLASYIPVINPAFPDAVKLQWMGQNGVPYIVHRGWENKEQRLKQSAYWKDIWNARDGSDKVKELTAEEYDAIEYKPHGLPDWRLDA